MTEWTDTKKLRLTKMVKNGSYSGAQIAEACGVSYKAMCNQANVMGLAFKKPRSIQANRRSCT